MPCLPVAGKQIKRDLERGLRDNDYIRDENADNLRAAIKQLERCGVRCYSLERTVDDLAWFVGGAVGGVLGGIGGSYLGGWIGECVVDITWLYE